MVSAKELIPKFTGPYRCILMFGPPGSGKGTQAKLLCAAGRHVHLSSGDIFRSLSPESPAGKLFEQYAHNGNLVPDDVTIEIWRHYLEGLVESNRYFPREQFLFLDGIPRTLNQAEVLDKYIKVEHVIVLEVKDTETLVERIRKRAIIQRRHDDAEDSILRTRMEVYARETSQVLSHYPEKIISRFNGDQKPLEVLRDILIKFATLL